MLDLTLHSSTQSNEGKKFLIKRIDENDIEITNEERMVILKALHANVRFVQVRDYTLMLNAIKSIEPKPREYVVTDYYLDEPVDMTDEERLSARNRLTEIKQIFGTKKIEGGDI